MKDFTDLRKWIKKKFFFKYNIVLLSKLLEMYNKIKQFLLLVNLSMYIRKAHLKILTHVPELFLEHVFIIFSATSICLSIATGTASLADRIFIKL